MHDPIADLLHKHRFEAHEKTTDVQMKVIAQVQAFITWLKTADSESEEDSDWLNAASNVLFCFCLLYVGEI